MMGLDDLERQVRNVGSLIGYGLMFLALVILILYVFSRLSGVLF